MPRLAISVSKLEGWASARPGSSGGVVNDVVERQQIILNSAPSSLYCPLQRLVSLRQVLLTHTIAYVIESL